MEKITGDWPALTARLAELAADGGDAWLDVEYTGDELLPDLHARVSELVDGSRLAVVKIGNRPLARLALSRNSSEETLDDLDPAAVFDRCLDGHGIAETDRADLRLCHAEILHSLLHSDVKAE
jgi:exonuclease SbcD